MTEPADAAELIGDPFHAAPETSPIEAADTPVHHNASQRSFVRNVTFSYLATFASLLAGVFVTPVLFRRLGVDGFGVFTLVTSIAGFALLADLGVGTTTVRRVASAVAQGDEKTLLATLSASRLLLRGSAVLSFAVLAVVAWQLPALFALPGGRVGDARAALLIVAVAQSALIAFSTPTSVVIGHGRSDLYAKRSLVLGLATAVAQCVVAVLGGGVVGVAVAVAVSYLVSAVIGLRLQRIVLGRTPARAPLVPGTLRDVVREGSANFAVAICGAVAFTSDAIVLGALAPFAAVATYAIAAKLPTLIRMLSSKAIDLLPPTYSHLQAADSDGNATAAMFTVLARTTKFSLALAIAAGLATCTSLRLLLDAWLGYTPKGAQTVVYLLTAATVLQMSGHAIFVLLTGVRRLRPLLWFSIGSAAANITLSVVLTPRLGAAGPALASLICVGIGDLFVLPTLAAATLRSSPLRVIGQLTLVPALPAVPAIGVAFAIGAPTASGWAVVVSAVVVGVYVTGFLLLAGRNERRWAFAALRRFTRRAAS